MIQAILDIKKDAKNKLKLTLEDINTIREARQKH